MKRNRECFLQSDDETFQINSEESCKRLKENKSSSSDHNIDNVILLLDQSFKCDILLQLYHRRQRIDLCNQVLAFLISRICFDQAVLQSVNLLDRL